jgi:hypothetical protein
MFACSQVRVGRIGVLIYELVEKLHGIIITGGASDLQPVGK